MSTGAMTGGQAPARPESLFRPNMAARKARGYIFAGLGLASILIGLGLLGLLFFDVLVRGLPWLNSTFLDSFESRFAERAGIKAALYGTAWMIFFTILFSLPVGVMAAIYLEEYAADTRI